MFQWQRYKQISYHYEQGMVVGHLGGIHAVLTVVLTARQEFHFFSIFRMILQILEEFGKGGKYIIRDIAA